MKYLIILNDPPYGTERSYNGLRIAGELAKREGEELKLFMMGDAAACAKKGQTTPNGYYNLERMLKVAARGESPQGVCGSCLDARGISDDELIATAHRSSMAELTEWTIWADKVLVF